MFYKISTEPSEYLDYLREYAKHFDINKYINYNKSILSIKRKKEKWEVEVKCELTSEVKKEIFDGLAICTGTHQIPNMPDIKDMDKFSGKIHHGSSYKNNENFIGKNVVVVGIGESSADIVREISDVSKNCHLVIRNYPFLIPRNQDHEAADANTSRSLSKYSYPDNILLKFMLLTYSVFYKSFTSIKNVFLKNSKPKSDSFSQNTTKEFLDYNTEKKKDFIKLIKSWNILAGALPEGKFATKNVTFVENIISEKIDVKKDEISHFVEEGVVLKSNILIPCDDVVFCTGYKDEFDFLEDKFKINNVRELYFNSFHPDMKNVAFIGWNRPSLGAIPACSEMVARYFSLLLSGKKHLPVDIKDQIKTRKECLEKRFAKSPNVLTVIDYHEFMSELSKLIGCNIKWSTYLLRPFMLYKMVFGGHMPLQYRLFGPHNDRKKVEQYIKKLPISPYIQKAALKLSFIHILNRDISSLMEHKKIINKLFLPGITASEEDIKKYSYNDHK